MIKQIITIVSLAGLTACTTNPVCNDPMSILEFEVKLDSIETNLCTENAISQVILEDVQGN